MADYFLLGAGPACAQTGPRLIHLFVALTDDVHQEIVPVPAALGNGDDHPGRNLYWGAALGARRFFEKSAEWKEVATVRIRIQVCWNGPSLCIGREGRIGWPTIVLACASKLFFADGLKSRGAATFVATGWMVPVDCWLIGESAEQTRQRAVAVYAK